MNRTNKVPLILTALILIALVSAFTPTDTFAREINGYPKPPYPPCDYHYPDDDDCYNQAYYYQHHDDDCYNQVYYQHHGNNCYNQAYYHHYDDGCRHQAYYYQSKPKVTYTCVCYKTVTYYKQPSCCYSGKHVYQPYKSDSYSVIDNNPKLYSNTNYWYYRNGRWTQNP